MTSEIIGFRDSLTLVCIRRISGGVHLKKNYRFGDPTPMAKMLPGQFENTPWLEKYLFVQFSCFTAEADILRG